MPTEDEIRGLKRELASSSTGAEQRKQILAELAARGDRPQKSSAAVETRAPAKARATKKPASDAATE